MSPYVRPRANRGRTAPTQRLRDRTRLSATLLERHQSEKKREAGIHCRRRGRKAAALDAAGAVLGGYGLVAFGCVAWLTLPTLAAIWALSAAALAWLVIAVSLWRVRRSS